MLNVFLIPLSADARAEKTGDLRMEILTATGNAFGSPRLWRVQSGVAPDCGGTRDFSRARMHDWRSTSKSFGRDARNHPRDAGATTNHNDLGAFISRWRKAGASRRARRLGLATNGAHGVTRPTAAGGGKRGGRLQRPPGAASRRCQNQFWDGRTGQRAFEFFVMPGNCFSHR